MKRFITYSLLITSSIICSAIEPPLNVEKVFNMKEFRAPGHEIVKINQPGNYFRNVEAKNDPQLLKVAKKAVEDDSRRASNIVEGYDGDDGENYMILQVPGAETIINIGFHWTDDGAFRLFMQSDPIEFKGR